MIIVLKQIHLIVGGDREGGGDKERWTMPSIKIINESASRKLEDWLADCKTQTEAAIIISN